MELPRTSGKNRHCDKFYPPLACGDTKIRDGHKKPDSQMESQPPSPSGNCQQMNQHWDHAAFYVQFGLFSSLCCWSRASARCFAVRVFNPFALGPKMACKRHQQVKPSAPCVFQPPFALPLEDA
eukprot:EG_transcript_29589